MIYDYIENIIDNKLPLGKLEYVEQKEFGHEARGIYCIKKEYEQIVNKLEQFKNLCDETESSVRINLNKSYYAVIKKDDGKYFKDKHYEDGPKDYKCIKIMIIEFEGFEIFTGDNINKEIKSLSTMKCSYIIYNNSDNVYYNYHGSSSITPFPFRINCTNNEKHLENFLTIAFLEYYKETYGYLFKDYYNECIDNLNTGFDKKLSIRPEAMFKAKTKEEYFALSLKHSEKLKNYNFNKHSFYTGYTVSKIFNAVDEKSKKWLINQPELTYSSSKRNHKTRTIATICGQIIVNNLTNKTESNDSLLSEAEDYATMIQKMRHKITITPMSQSALKKRHDDALAAVNRSKLKHISNTSLVPKDSKFQKLYDNISEEFIPLTNAKDLFIEGEKQHNCVYHGGYPNSIKRDLCAIFRTNLSGYNYTIEIRQNNGKYMLEQLKKTYNEDYDTADYTYITNELKRINNIQTV